MKIIDIAKVCHEANKIYCESIGDFSQKCWDEAPQWQKDSAINGVKHNIENAVSDAEQSHNLWMEEKLRTGWKYGPEKDPENKIHPCLLPYYSLPQRQKFKNALFLSIIDIFRSVVTYYGKSPI